MGILMIGAGSIVRLFRWPCRGQEENWSFGNGEAQYAQ
jgi:hypothetical protein